MYLHYVKGERVA